jgi:hypothetical protein
MLHIIILNVPTWLQFISKWGVECSTKTVFYMVTIYKKINKTHHTNRKDAGLGEAVERRIGEDSRLKSVCVCSHTFF